MVAIMICVYCANGRVCDYARCQARYVGAGEVSHPEGVEGGEGPASRVFLFDRGEAFFVGGRGSALEGRQG